MNKFITVILLFLCSASVIANEFDSYPANAEEINAFVKPNVSTGKAHLYRTLLTSEYSLGANFNGHFRIVKWGCGMQCVEWGIMDLKTGATWFAQDSLKSCYPDEDQWEKFKFKGNFESSKISSLFYVYECNHGAHYKFMFDTKNVYQWKDGRPVLLRKEVIE